MIAAPPFGRCVVISFVIHAGFLFAGRGLTPAPAVSTVEIDLTNPLPGSGPAKLAAPKRLSPDAPPKDWVLPGPQTKKVEAQPAEQATPGGAVGGTGISPMTGGSGMGSAYGSPDGTGTGGSPSVTPPRLLNLDEIRANLRKFYPESERRAGREGSVMLGVHVGASGLVSGADVMVSAGPAFDGAAQKVARLMRFAPAVGPSGPVAVRIAAPVIFRLED